MLSRPQGHNSTGSIKSLKNSSDPIGNRTRDLSACSAVPRKVHGSHLCRGTNYLTHLSGFPPISSVHTVKRRFLPNPFQLITHQMYLARLRTVWKVNNTTKTFTTTPTGLRQGSAAERLMRLRVRIPLGAWMFVSVCRAGRTKRRTIRTQGPRKEELKNISPVAWIFVLCVLCSTE